MKKLSDTDLFTLENNKRGIRKRDIRKNLKKFYELNNLKPFSQNTYNKWKDKICTPSNIFRTYGSWELALKDADIKLLKKNEYTLKELTNHFEKVWRWAEKRPTSGDLEAYNKKFGTTIDRNLWSRKFGTLDNFVINFVKLKQNEISFREFEKLVIPKKNKKSISLKLRSEVLKRDKYRCQHCGASAKGGASLHVDHIIPESKGGKTNLSNLQVLCADCNLGKSNKFVG